MPETTTSKAVTLSLTETLTWTPASTKPVHAALVLCFGHGSWFSGWWDDVEREWYDCDGRGIVEGVSHWAHVQGPQA